MTYKKQYEEEKIINDRLRRQNRQILTVSMIGMMLLLFLLIAIVNIDTARDQKIIAGINNHYQKQIYACDDMYQTLLNSKCDVTRCERQLNMCNQLYQEAINVNKSG